MGLDTGNHKVKCTSSDIYSKVCVCVCVCVSLADVNQPKKLTPVQICPYPLYSMGCHFHTAQLAEALGATAEASIS